MAWTAQAWRYSLAGVIDPAQILDEQQTRLTIAGVTTSSDLYVSPAWDYDETLTLVGIPLGTTGFDVTTRAALANFPARGLVDNVNRDGATTAALGGFTVAFDGSVVNPGYDGDLVVTLSPFTTAFAGEYTDRLFFDVTYSISPTWSAIEIPANFGDVAFTLGGFTSGLSGTALPPDSTTGAIEATLAAFATNFDGTYTAPPTFAGVMGLDIEAFGVSYTGTHVPSGGVIGSISTALGDFSTNFDGTFGVWSTDGASSLSLDAFSMSWRAAFIDADAIYGLMDAEPSSFAMSLNGTIDSSGVTASRIKNAFNMKHEKAYFRIQHEKAGMRVIR